jgi:hypothetical protein
MLSILKRLLSPYYFFGAVKYPEGLFSVRKNFVTWFLRLPSPHFPGFFLVRFDSRNYPVLAIKVFENLDFFKTIDFK